MKVLPILKKAKIKEICEKIEIKQKLENAIKTANALKDKTRTM